MAFFSTREEEKRREVETASDSTDSERTRLQHGRYFEVPTFCRCSLSLSLSPSLASPSLDSPSPHLCPLGEFRSLFPSRSITAVFFHTRAGSFSRSSVQPFDLTSFSRFPREASLSVRSRSNQFSNQSLAKTHVFRFLFQSRDKDRNRDFVARPWCCWFSRLFSVALCERLFCEGFSRWSCCPPRCARYVCSHVRGHP